MNTYFIFIIYIISESQNKSKKQKTDECSSVFCFVQYVKSYEILESKFFIFYTTYKSLSSATTFTTADLIVFTVQSFSQSLETLLKSVFGILFTNSEDAYTNILEKYVLFAVFKKGL